MSEIFNDDDYVKILQNRFGISDIEFLKAERESFSQDVEGFMGEHFILNLTYKSNNNISKESFFVKTLPKKSEYQQKLNEEFGTYVKETYIYSTLIEEFKKCGYDISFAPRCYYCKNQETLVMENMRLNDFRLYERGKSYDLPHCKESLKALAQYHANSIAYEEIESKRLGRVFRLNEKNPEAFKEIFFIDGDTTSACAKFIQQTKICYKTLCRFITESEEWKQKFYTKLDDLDCGKIFNQELKSRKTCGHGDLWSNNMLFKYENGVPTKCRLVDFQLIRHHHPVYDAMLVIHSNTDRAFRKKHYQELIKFYYEYLCLVLTHHGLNPNEIMPKDDFFEAARVLEPIAVFQAVSVRSFVKMPKDILNKVHDKDGEVSFQDMIEKDRSTVVIECCKKDEEIKKSFIEDIYDLNEYL